VTKDTTLSRQIAEEVQNHNEYQTIQPIHIGEDNWRNELVLFVKPEIFTVEKTEFVKNFLDVLLEKLNEFKVKTNGILVVSGKILAEKKIMDRHYGFINKLSRSASEILDETDRKKIAKNLEIQSIDEYEMLGGHEYLLKYADEDCFSLDEFWLSKKSIKIRSGFYVQKYKRNDRNLILVNGFHPAQLAHYTNPAHRIVLILVHSNTDWAVLRNQMIGATFPEKAVSGSIRKILYERPKEFGLQSVNVANNGVHLSAGPFEAMFEILNFFGEILGSNANNTTPVALQKMIDSNLDRKKALRILENPEINHSPKPTDLFTLTEDMDTDEAITLFEKAEVL